LAALSSPEGGQAIAPLEVQSYQQEFGVSPREAEEHLATQERGANIVEELKDSQSSHYAGVWFDNESGEFVVPTVSAATRATAASALVADGLEGDFRTKAVQSSWAELQAAHQALDKALLPLFEEHLVQTFLDPRANAVVIRLSEAAGKAQREEVQSAIASEDVEVELRHANAARFKLGFMKCDEIEKACGRPLRGGVAIGEHTNGFGQLNPACTAGFKAIGNTSGNRFVLTAGHCGEDGGKWKAANGDTFEEKPEGIGFAEGINYPGGDWEAIKANGSYWDTSPWPSKVAVWGGELERSIESESSSYPGEWVCHSGLTTGTTCGYVQWLDLTAEVKQPGGSYQLEYHLTDFEGSEVCADHGDSGGPVFAGHTALGLLSAAEEGAPTCGTHAVVYVEITRATEALGVSVAPQVGAPPVAETYEATEFPPPNEATLDIACQRGVRVAA
jgi:hypothetical protein